LRHGRYAAATLLLSVDMHPRVFMALLGHSQMRTPSTSTATSYRRSREGRRP